MNCQDIFRLVDTGHYAGLSESERRDAEAHARDCPHCAPVWVAHARMAQQHIPPMPAELATRVRTLAAVPVPATSGHAWRRLTVVGGLVALAAAASVLMVYVPGIGTAEDELPAAALEPTLESARPAGPGTSAPTANEVTIAVATPMASAPEATPTSAPLPPLPLLPMPVHGAEALLESLQEPALQKVVEQHPELVEGPDLDDTFAGAALLREDGTLVSSTVELATRDGLGEANARVRRTMPKDGAISTSIQRPKHFLLPNGRVLRANVYLRIVIVSNEYDVARSDVRVLQILGEKYSASLMPANAPEMKRLTVFLSDDGRILREKMDDLSSQPGNSRTLMGNDPDDADFLARNIAERLDMNSAEIGLMGFTSLEEGTRTLTSDADGNLRPTDSRRILPVYYAWQRRPAEAGPAFGQPGPTENSSTFDPAAAQRIVEREIPDAFTFHDASAGEPTVVLTAKGELIRAGRVNFRKNGGGAMDTILQEQLVPGVRTSSYSSVRLRNNLGQTADVQFAWEMPEDMKAAMKRAEADRAAAQAVGTGAQ